MNDLILRGFSIDWDQIEEDSYLRGIAALDGLGTFSFQKPVTFFAGANGSGKSTLLEALAIASGFNPEGGTRNYSFSTYDSHSELCDAVRLVKSGRKVKWGYFLRAESFYNVATKEMEYADLAHPSAQYHRKSHGESFLALTRDQFKGAGLYLLDEPEAALSPQGQLSLLYVIHTCVKAGAQFLIASHSPILLGYPGAEILSFDEGPIHPCAYEETDSYQITKMCLDHRELMLRNLFGEEIDC